METTRNTPSGAAVLDTARMLYEGEGLALPPVPAGQAPGLRQIGPAAFASRDLDWTLYDFADFLDDLQSGDAPEPYVAFGLSGHGLALQAAHYYAVTAHCAVLFQMRWGTPMNRPEQDRQRHDAVLSLAHKLQAAAEARAASGGLLAGQRMVAAESSFHGARWAWLPADEPVWHPSRGGVMMDALIAVKQRG
ncbi:hypothetical protein ACXIUT_14550 [Achromobacter denitrificans]